MLIPYSFMRPRRHKDCGRTCEKHFSGRLVLCEKLLFTPSLRIDDVDEYMVKVESLGICLDNFCLYKLLYFTILSFFIIYTCGCIVCSHTKKEKYEIVTMNFLNAHFGDFHCKRLQNFSLLTQFCALSIAMWNFV